MHDHEATAALSSRTLASAIDRLEELRGNFDGVVRVAQAHADVIAGSVRLKDDPADRGAKVQAPAPSSIVDRVHYEIDGLNQRLYALAEQQARIGHSIGRPEKDAGLAPQGGNVTRY